VSLLLDALKRAEQEKLTRQVDRPAAGERPAAPAIAAAANAPNAATGLELQPLASAPASPRGDAPPGAQAAQAVFRAKMPVQPQRNRSALWAAVAAIVVVLIAAGAYVWYSIRTLPLPRPAAMARVRAEPIAPSPDLTALPARQPPAGSAPVLPPMPVATVDPLPTQPKAAAAAPGPQAPASAPSPVDELLKEPALATQAPVKLARTEVKPRVPPQVEEGYEALLAGDLATAHARYAAGVEADPTNVDALLGLATVDARSGDIPAAAGAYRRALALDPQNATALAGLAALASDARPDALEFQLRSDLALHPDSAALQLTLGNVYAAQGRWADAQAAYFEAHRLQPENADIAYNLAVSLDHLGQRRPAADFYRRALASRRGATSQFDAAAAARRLEELGR